MNAHSVKHSQPVIKKQASPGLGSRLFGQTLIRCARLLFMMQTGSLREARATIQRGIASLEYG